MKNDIFKQDYNAIAVERRINIIGISCWINITTIYRNPLDESLAIYHRTRDHYLNQWGKGNVRLTLLYPHWKQIH